MVVRADKVLVIELDIRSRRAIADGLAAHGFSVEAKGVFDVARPLDASVIVLGLDPSGGPEMARQMRGLKHEDPAVEVIVLVPDLETASEAMQAGAYDYLLRPAGEERLVLLVGRAVEKRRLAEENLRLRQRLSLKDEYGKVVGKSSRISSVYEVVAQVAVTNATVLISGESGTGKELVARAIHQRSERRGRPLVSLNCGALPEGLLESELFGFERGAFTGAVEAKAGKFELADGGTLLLDEVGEMSPKTQVEFLRVLQEKEFRRLGGDRLIRVDVRIIACTNKELLEEVHAGRFRQDLYYRLAVVPVHMPSLRERREDIPLLVDAFIQEFAEANKKPVKKISPEALNDLLAYDWPGNIRELRNVIERITVMVEEPLVRPEHIPPEVGGRGAGGAPERGLVVPLGTSLKKVEEAVIRRTLESFSGHREKAARALGISPRALQYKIARYGLARKRRAKSSRA